MRRTKKAQRERVARDLEIINRNAAQLNADAESWLDYQAPAGFEDDTQDHEEQT